RILDIFKGAFDEIKTNLIGKYYSDEEVKVIISRLYKEKGYVIDPHSAIGYQGLKDYFANQSSDLQGVFLGTAHPAKFLEVVEPVISTKVELPLALSEAMKRPSKSEK